MKVILLFSMIFLANCASKVMPTPHSFNNEAKGITLDIHWVKHKGDAMDISFSVENNYPYDVAMREGSLTISFEGVKYSRIVQPNPYLYLEAGARMGDIATFEFPKGVVEKGKGEVKITGLKKTDKTGAAVPDLVGEFHLH